MIKIYSDGSCRGNGTNNSSGGYGLAIYKENNSYNIVHVPAQGETTNNREEMSALIEALRLSVEDFSSNEVEIYSDSAYCVNMFNDWIHKWALNNWQNSKKVTVENLDLVKELYKYAEIGFPNFAVKKIKGHNGDIGNELADAAATNDLTKLAKIKEKYNLTIER